MKFAKGLIGVLVSAMFLVIGAYCVGGLIAYFQWAQTEEQSESAPRWVRDLYPYLLIDPEEVI